METTGEINNSAGRNNSAGWKRPKKLITAQGGIMVQGGKLVMYRRIFLEYYYIVCSRAIPRTVSHFQEHEKINSVQSGISSVHGENLGQNK